MVRGIKAWFPDSTSQYIDSLEALLEGVSRIISAKTKRFRSKCSAITAYGDAFELITQPTEQIAIIIDEAHRFFPTRIGADKDQLDITVLHETSPGEWDFLATSNHTWTRVSPNSIMEGPSLAKKCLTSGECCFIPDKRLASEQGCYILSDRDRSHGVVGSAYCAPLAFRIGTANYRYLVTFSTYGARICEVGDKETGNNAKHLFDEFVKRIELELLLNSIKTHKHTLKRNPNEVSAATLRTPKDATAKPTADKP